MATTSLTDKQYSENEGTVKLILRPEMRQGKQAICVDLMDPDHHSLTESVCMCEPFHTRCPSLIYAIPHGSLETRNAYLLMASHKG